MKLIKCYVSSFGKLKDYSYDFSDGLNTFKENNGWGKSTLATFIKAMFYGLNSGKRSVAENERIKFRPWNTTEKFGGYLCFEKDGKNYRIERYFGNKESEDTVKLFDDQTGKEFIKTENLGFRLFKIDEEGFLSTTYFSQKDFQIKSNSSLTAKYNSVCEIEDSEVFDKALSKVEDKAKFYKYRGDKGAIAEIKHEISQIDGEIFQATKSADAIGLLKQDLNELENKVENLKNNATALTEKVALAGKAEALSLRKARRNELNAEKDKLVLEKANLDSVLNGNKPELGKISVYIDCNNELGRIAAAENVIKEDLKALETEKPLRQAKNNLLSTILFSIGTLVFLAFIILSISVSISSLGSILSIIIAVAFAVVGAVYLLTGKKDTNAITQYEQLITRKSAEIAEYEDIKRHYIEKIDAFISSFNVDMEQDRGVILSKIFTTVENYDKIITQLNTVNSALLEFEDVKDTSLKDSVPIEDLNTLNVKLRYINEEYANETARLANKRAIIKNHENFAASITELESKKSELSALFTQYSEEYEILMLTAQYLKQADENLKVKYRAPLQDSLNKYLNFIDGGNMIANIDIDLAVTIEEKDGKKVTDYYSKGYQNLFEICKRFALTDVLFNQDKPFIILDDPFYNLDDEKLKSATNLIKSLSEEYQILYFVCHESRRV